MLLLRILLGIAAVLSLKTDLGVAGADDDGWTWSLVFDAGSSGTRLLLFKIKREAGKPDEFKQFTPEGQDENGVDKEDKLKLSPGLSGLVKGSNGNLENAGKLVRADLKKLLAEAAQYVPKDEQASTPVRLGATAGLRLLTIKEQDDIMNLATQALSDKTINPFKSYGAIVLSGEEEAVFGWLAVNYFLGNFKTYDEKNTVGALDLGGASTQIAYRSPSQVLEGQQSTTVNGNPYRIFATSFLKFGNDQFGVQVFERIKEDSKPGKTNSSEDQPYQNPCQCKGFKEQNDNGWFLGTGKWDDCSTLVGKILNLDDEGECVFTDGNGRCTLVGKYLAPMAKNYYAFSSYFFAANGIGLLGWSEAKKLSPNNFMTAGKTWCAKTVTTFPEPAAKYKPDYCRQSVYIYHLLTKAYGFKADDATSISFARKINGFEASWAMGLAMSYSPSSDIATVETERDTAEKEADAARKAQKAAEAERDKVKQEAEAAKKAAKKAQEDAVAAALALSSSGIGIGAGHGLAICVGIAIAFTA